MGSGLGLGTLGGASFSSLELCLSMCVHGEKMPIETDGEKRREKKREANNIFIFNLLTFVAEMLAS